jgi:hypothetical protein
MKCASRINEICHSTVCAMAKATHISLLQGKNFKAKPFHLPKANFIDAVFDEMPTSRLEMLHYFIGNMK